MKKISTAISRFCYDHPNFGIQNLMLYIMAGNALVYVLDLFSQGSFSPMLDFIPAYLAQGQVWRLVTFVLVPEDSNPFFLLISLYFYYWIGSSLERTWGTARFNLFYLFGYLAAVLVGVISCFVYGFAAPFPVTSTYYLNLSLFLALAMLYPDTQILLMMIIPVKIKWIAYLDVFLLLVGILQSIGAGMYVSALLPVLALGGFLLFFGDELLRALGNRAKSFQHRHSRQTVNFRNATNRIKQERGYIHKCSVCGVTDAEDPTMEFRYCSKCAGYRCYCKNHINNHEHIVDNS